MLTTINKHQWANHGPSHTQGIWQTFPHSWQLMLFHMSNVPSKSTEGYAPLPPQHGPSLFAWLQFVFFSLHTLSLVSSLCACVSVSHNHSFCFLTLSCASLSLSLSLKWFHSPPSFSPFMWQFGVLFSHLLCHSLSLQHTTSHAKSWREEGEGRSGWKQYFLKISFSRDPLGLLSAGI